MSAARSRSGQQRFSTAMSSSSRPTAREPLLLSVNNTVRIRPTSTNKSTAKQRGAGQRGQVGRRSQPSRSVSSRNKASSSTQSMIRPKLSWEGSSHRLEIHPPKHTTIGDGDEEGGEDLRMSDLTDGGGEGRRGEKEERTEEHRDIESMIQSLQTEVDQLTAKLEEEQRLHHHHTIPLTRSSLHRHDTGLVHPPPPPPPPPSAPPSPELKVLGQVASLMSSQLEQQRREEERVARKRREELRKRLEDVESQSGTVRDGIDQLHTSLKKLGKRQLTGAVMSQLGGQRSKLMQNLVEFKRDSRQLRKMLREQMADQEFHPALSTRSTGATATSTSTADPRLSLHAQGLHDELGRKEVELQSLMVHTQNVEEQLQRRDEEYANLQSDLHEYKRQTEQEKEDLKRTAKRYKKKVRESENTTEALGQELEDTRSQLTQLTSERTRQDTQLSSLSTRVRDLDNCLTQSKATAESSVEAANARLSEKTKELNLLQLDNGRLKTTVETIERALKTIEANSTNKIASLESELAQARTGNAQYEALTEEYKTELDECRQDCEETQRDLRRKEREVETLREDTSSEMEKYRRRFEQQLAELEPLPQLFKMSELRLRESQQRLATCEQRLVEQSRLVEELTTKCGRQQESAEEMKHRLVETETENRSLLTKLDTAHRRVEEADSQNREMVAITRQREENMQLLKCQVEESQGSVISLQAQLQKAENEARRQQEHVRDKAVGKERAHLARIADLESQLTKSNSLNNQLRKSNEDAERLHHSRIRSIQEQLDTANASRRSMETYINFLKASYSSLCCEAGSNSVPPFHMLS